MTAPPGATATLTPHGIATAIASHAEADCCPDEAALIAEYKAAGKRLSPSRARMLVAQRLAAADRRADRASDPDADTRINGITSDPTPREAFRNLIRL